MAQKITVEIIGDASDLEKAFGRASSSAKGFESNMSKVSRSAGIAGAAITGGFALVLKNGFEELAEAQKVGAQSEAVLKSTGGAARVTKKDIEGLAGAISEYSGIDDEAIQSGENLLLTFTNVRNEVGKGNDIFNQATSIMADMSVGLGQDMSSSAMQLGKALNDPIKGVTALQRVGVTFTEAQKKSIKAMVEHGDAAGAQKIILRELAKEFGGSAKAAGDTLPGKLAKAKNAFDEMTASIAELLLPALEAAAGVLQDVSGFLTNHPKLAKAVTIALGTLGVALLAVSVATKAYAAASAIGTAATWALNAAFLANPVVLIVAGIVALGAALVIAYQRSETFRNVVDAAFGAAKAVVLALVDAFESVVDWLSDNWQLVATIISGPFAPLVALATDAFGVRSALEGAFQKVKDWVTENWQAIATLISGPFSPLVALATDAFGVRTELVNAFKTIKNTAESVIDGVVDFFTKMAGRLEKVPGELLSKIATPIGGAFDLITGAIQNIKTAISWIGANMVSIWGKVKAKLGPVVDGIIAILQPFLSIVQAIKGAIQWVIEHAPDIPSIDLPNPLGIGDGKAGGGPVKAGVIYPVGERGPELFVPNVAGRIVPNHELGSKGSAVPMVGVSSHSSAAAPMVGELHVHGSILSEDELYRLIRNKDREFRLGNPTSGFSLP